MLSFHNTRVPSVNVCYTHRFHDFARLHAVPFFSFSNWETGESKMRDRTRDWSELGRRPRLCLSLAPVSQLLWTRKERDCVQSMILCTARFLRVLYAEICDCCEMFIKCSYSLLLHRLNVKQGRMTYWKVVLLDRKACWCWARTCKIEEWNLPVVWWHGVWNFTEKVPQVSPRNPLASGNVLHIPWATEGDNNDDD